MEESISLKKLNWMMILKLRALQYQHLRCLHQCYSRHFSSHEPIKPKAVAFDMGGVVIPTPLPLFNQFEDAHGLERGSIVMAIRAGGEKGNKSYHCNLTIIQRFAKCLMTSRATPRWRPRIPGNQSCAPLWLGREVAARHTDKISGEKELERRREECLELNLCR